jgi:hypothetical protein
MANKIYTEPPESEHKYQRLAALGRELGVPVPQVFLEMQVTMPDGRVVHHHKQRSHSWVRNAYNFMFSQLGGVDGNDSTYAAGKISIKQTSGTVTASARAISNYSTSSQLTGTIGYTAQAAVIANGIVVGYDTATAESFEGYVLINPILEGTTNDGHHLNNIASQAYTYAYDTPSKTLTVTLIRFFNNNSGGNVVVGEAALYINGNQGSTPLTWMNSRDHLGSPVTIPNTGQLKVTYTISLVYPA